MEIRQLRYFLAVAEECHFGRAAVRLHIAQPALSQQIKQLEGELGLALFTRTTRHVELTEAGHQLADHARTVVAGEERARSHMHELAAGRAGRVSVGFIGTATYDVLPKVARTVKERLPGVTMDLHGEVLAPRLVEGLLNDTYDLVVVREAAPGEGIRITSLRTEPLVAVLPSHHPLAGRRRMALRDLADEPFVIHPSQARSSMYKRVLAACKRAGFEPSPLVEVSETATLVVFVAAGHGVALVPQSVQSLSLEGVTYVPLADAEAVDLLLVCRMDRMSPATTRVAAVIEECVRD
ncbi:LysR substrate-binding domain-containing protein [Streptomyces malaysiensis]|uniref:LysR family transcriptional regulator n=1 Tax=Streptomyces malaysiensis TaxID=92644 RepID=A0A7X6B1G0_STRMQ|nr:LysR substrate-binding domain-containing protein [Streptomyces malaysiensis]NIY69262.1 LysR family transcriptional regulator [Streptomyces malaysiensis]